MLDTRLLNLVSANRPGMNPDICNGLSAIHVQEEIEGYINDVFRSAAESFPPQFKYLGFQRCTPYEEFREIVRPQKPRRSFELSRSSVYMVKYLFSFEGREMRPRYIFLPFINDGGIIYLKGTQYKVSPVLGGRAFNIERGRVFMGTPRARLVFAKTPVSFMLNERVHHADVVYSPLYNLQPDERSKLYSTLVHYMLAEFGLHGTMRRFFDTEIKVGERELDALIETGEWYVFRSRQMAPTGRGRAAFIPSEIRIAIPADKYQPILNSIIGAVFYIIDNCPEAITAEDTESSENWLRILSRFIFKTTDSERKMFDEMTNHLTSIRHYMDPITRANLAKEKILCRDIFDLLHHLNVNFHDMVIHHDVGSMYNLELTTTKHIAYNIVHNIFSMMFEIMKLSGDRITFENVTGVMDKILRRDKIFTVNKHGELSADGIATDCKPYAATCNIISQTRASAAGKSQKHQNAMGDPSLLLHHSQVEVGSYQMMSKAEPSGRAKANPYMHLVGKSYIAPNPGMVEYVAHLKELLSH
jgi:hypothetical protein